MCGLEAYIRISMDREVAAAHLHKLVEEGNNEALKRICLDNWSLWTSQNVRPGHSKQRVLFIDD